MFITDGLYRIAFKKVCHTLKGVPFIVDVQQRFENVVGVNIRLPQI